MKINEIKLERPLFYNNPIGLRFEIGPSDIGIWADREARVFSQEYFKIALDRALSIFHAAFSSSDDVSIVYQMYSDGRRRIKRGAYILRQINRDHSRNVIFSDHREIYADDLERKCECWRRATISGMTVKDANVENILSALINLDFRSRTPSIKGECYFVNESKGLVLNLYDDRGMDVVALEKEALVDLYHSRNEWLLNYDRDRIDRVFSKNISV